MKKKTVMIDVNEVKVRYWDEIIEILEDTSKDEEMFFDALIQKKEIIKAIEEMDKIGGLNGER